MGGQREYALNYTIYEGLTLAENYPYTDKDGHCQYNRETDKVFNISHYKIYEHMATKDLEQLICKGPVTVGMKINQCVMSY